MLRMHLLREWGIWKEDFKPTHKEQQKNFLIEIVTKKDISYEMESKNNAGGGYTEQFMYDNIW